MSDIVASAGLALFKTYAPKGFDWLWHQIVGKKVLICGVARAGKTSFSKYLVTRTLLHENTTHRTVRHEKIPDTKIKLHTDSSHVCRIKGSYDSPGQWEPENQASSVIDYTPNYLFIFLDCSRIDDSIEWFTRFIESLEYELRTSSHISSKLSEIYIVLNKYDKIANNQRPNDNNRYTEFSKLVLGLCYKNIEQAYIRLLREKREPIIFPCVAVKTKHDSEWIDEIINTLGSNF